MRLNHSLQLRYLMIIELGQTVSNSFYCVIQHSLLVHYSTLGRTFSYIDINSASINIRYFR